MLAELDRTGADQISLTDPDARAMARMTKVGVGYNIQLAIDVKHKLIAETATVAMEAVADRGYFKIEDIEACEAAGVTAYVPKPIRGPAVREGFFGKEVFRYEPDEDVFVCPAGATLSPRYRGKSLQRAPPGLFASRTVPDRKLPTPTALFAAFCTVCSTLASRVFAGTLATSRS
jgi:hypothetical protein